jgi:hypothetical protein
MAAVIAARHTPGLTSFLLLLLLHSSLPVCIGMTSKPKTDGLAKDYKYASEISQMVGSSLRARHCVFTTLGQMFVFGEVTEANPDTVCLVEDIVRSQIIELVSGFTAATIRVLIVWPHRLYKPVRLQASAASVSSLPRTLYFSSVTTELRSTVYARTSHGKTSANTPRNPTETSGPA